MIRSAIVLLYSLLLLALMPLLKIAARFSPRIKDQIDGRAGVPALAGAIARERARKRRCVVFYCSSAGEFEQARPLVERIARLPSVYVQTIFFSKSGLDFVRARGETLPCCLSPATDSVWHWGWLFAALRPDVVAVVRHELWPGFLEAAHHYAKVYLIDASRSLGESRSRLKRFGRSWLLKGFDGIYAVAPADLAYFRDDYGIPAGRLQVAGDTKYDRVRERAAAKAGDVQRLKALFDGWRPKAATKRLVIGSAYRQEVELYLAARQARPAAAPRWQAVIAPHQLSAEMTAWIRERCRGAGLTMALYSQISSGTAPSPPSSEGSEGAEVILVDTMGILAEAYGTADAAFVGGALHHQVHNVLEPACHGLALAFGPFYKNSQEALHLVQAELATVVTDAQELGRWWARLDQAGDALAARMVEEVRGLTGASDRIMADWAQYLGAP
jgi:3-deoxy-D-manno-octulosonic-acid transferase